MALLLKCTVLKCMPSASFVVGNKYAFNRLLPGTPDTDKLGSLKSWDGSFSLDSHPPRSVSLIGHNSMLAQVMQAYMSLHTKTHVRKCVRLTPTVLHRVGKSKQRITCASIPY
eukprot:1161512-Pelagomonas_calceolata.AAC.27